MVGEQVLGERRAGFGQQDGALELVRELTDVAGERVALERGDGLGGGLADGLPHLRGEAGDEMARERRYVLEAIAERRQADREDAEPIEEVLAGAPRLHLVLELPVRRDDDADVDLPVARVAHGPDLALLQDAQQLRLQARRRLRDLVQEERAAVGDLEEALLVGDRAREGAALVAEELALEDALGERGAVHGHEEAVRTRAPVVDGARDQLLARARLALDQDGAAVRRHLVDERQHLVHDRLADDAAGIGGRPGSVLGGEPCSRAGALRPGGVLRAAGG
jgi:hypothetical protein